MQSVILVAWHFRLRRAFWRTARVVKQASGLHRGHQGTAAQQVQHAFEIVGEHMQAHLGIHSVESLGEGAPIQDFSVPNGCSTV